MICIIVTMFASANIPPLAYQFPRPPDTQTFSSWLQHHKKTQKRIKFPVP